MGVLSSVTNFSSMYCLYFPLPRIKLNIISLSFLTPAHSRLIFPFLYISQRLLLSSLRSFSSLITHFLLYIFACFSLLRLKLNSISSFLTSAHSILTPSYSSLIFPLRIFSSTSFHYVKQH